MTRGEMDPARLGQLRHHHRHRRCLRRSPQLRHGGDRPRARSTGFRVGIIAQPVSTAQRTSPASAGPICISASPPATWIRWSTATPRAQTCVRTMPTPGRRRGKRPDRAVIVYSQRCREAFRDVPIVIGGIEASLRRIAHFDYWREGAAFRADRRQGRHAAVRQRRARNRRTGHRMAGGRRSPISRTCAGMRLPRRMLPADWTVIDSTHIDAPGRIRCTGPYLDTTRQDAPQTARDKPPPMLEPRSHRGDAAHASEGQDRHQTVVRLPAFEAVRDDPVLYAHASRVPASRVNPGNARALVQRHGDRDVWINPPPIPLRTRNSTGYLSCPTSGYHTRPTGTRASPRTR